MKTRQLYGYETQEQMLKVLKQKGEAQRKKWEHGLFAIAGGAIIFVLLKAVCFQGRNPGNWFWYLFGVVIDLPLIYIAARYVGSVLGYGRPTAFDREVLDLLIVREEDTMAIWKTVYVSLNRSSHPVFREYVVRELSAGRALPGSSEELNELFRWELVAAGRKAEMPDGYRGLIADYRRRHGKEEPLKERG